MSHEEIKCDNREKQRQRQLRSNKGSWGACTLLNSGKEDLANKDPTVEEDLAKTKRLEIATLARYN